jgi:hypothetical protein
MSKDRQVMKKQREQVLWKNKKKVVKIRWQNKQTCKKRKNESEQDDNTKAIGERKM